MFNILDKIKEVITNNVEITMDEKPVYGRYPVTVTDKSESITSGWKLIYNISKSKFNSNAFDSYGRFSEVRISGFDSLYTMIQQAYVAFKNGTNVERRYDTNFAVYQPTDGFWFTLLERKDGVNTTITITDPNSPFHMLELVFFIRNSEQNNGQPYMVGYDVCYNAETNVYTEKMNAEMLPSKNRYVPITKTRESGSTIRAQGTLNNHGRVVIDERNTEIVYLQELRNERRMLAGIYETNILGMVMDKANEYFKAEASNNHNISQEKMVQRGPGENLNPFVTNKENDLQTEQEVNQMFSSVDNSQQNVNNTQQQQQQQNSNTPVTSNGVPVENQNFESNMPFNPTFTLPTNNLY